MPSSRVWHVVSITEISDFTSESLPPLQRLLLAYAPTRSRDWQSLCWLLDHRLAAVVRRGGDAMIATIRLAWWDGVLVEDDRTKGSGEPLVERWLQIAPAGVAGAAERLIEGWRILLSTEPLSDDDLHHYGMARGSGLAELIAAGKSETSGHAGAIWALWDMAAHVRDEALAVRALAIARDLAASGVEKPLGADLKPLRLALAVALPDVRAGRMHGSGFTLRQYGRLLRAALIS